MFKEIWRKSPVQECFEGNFVRRDESIRWAKQENNFIVPIMQSEYGKSSFYFRGITMWNPPKIRECQGIEAFDIMIKKWIMDKRKKK